MPRNKMFNQQHQMASLFSESGMTIHCSFISFVSFARSFKFKFIIDKRQPERNRFGLRKRFGLQKTRKMRFSTSDT